MTTEIVEWVSDIGEPTERGVRYINVAFEGGETAFIGKKDYDDALYIQGLLIEAKGKPTEFTLEDTGKKNKKGLTKFKIKAVGEYQPTPFQGGGESAQVRGNAGPAARGRSPESPRGRDEQFIQERMDRRTALMQAVEVKPNWGEGLDVETIKLANTFYNWLRSTVGPPSPVDEGALSQPSGSAPTTSAPEAHTDSLVEQPGPPSTGAGSSAEVTGLVAADAESGVGTSGALDGEASTSCPPHNFVLDKKPSGFAKCDSCEAWGKPK